MADMGLRVLLIDADVQPSLSKYYLLATSQPVSALSSATTKTSCTRCMRPKWNASSRCKARKPHEFGMKVSLAVARKAGPIVGASSFTCNPFDGYILTTQME